MKFPDTIYLLDDGSDEILWCEDPDPTDEVIRVAKYVKVSEEIKKENEDELLYDN